MNYKPLSVEEPVFDKFHASKKKYKDKCGVSGTVTEFLDLMIDIWDENQAIVEAADAAKVEAIQESKK